MSIYSNTETSLAMSTLAIWYRVVQSHEVSPHNFDGLAMSGLAFSVAPSAQAEWCAYARICVCAVSSIRPVSFSLTSMHTACPVHNAGYPFSSIHQ